MKSGEYWKQRFEAIEALTNQTEQAKAKFIDNQFALAEKRLREQIEGWYGRFATNNGITLAEAKKTLKAKDLAELKWDVETYIKYGKENAINGAWIKELENASARFHVTRLEALEIQARQTVEKLYHTYDQQAGDTLKKTYLDTYYHSIYEVNKGANVGWDIAAIDDVQLEKIINKPWTADGRTFSDRIWAQKQQLINEIHTQLTQNAILGRGADGAVNAISKKFNVSKKQAGRLVMTESAVFSNLAQKDAYKELDVEEFEVVETLDGRTCQICGAMDGKVFPMSDFQIGTSVPPFHPWCRGCTVPYFDDDYGARAARDEDGKTYYVPSDMKYEEWKEIFVDETKSKDGLKVYDTDGTITYAKEKPVEPKPPKKEYLTKKKLQTHISDADAQIVDLTQQQNDLLETTTYDNLIKDYGSIDKAYGDNLSADDLIEKTKLLELQSQIEEIKAQKQDWQTKLNKKLLIEQKKSLTKEEKLLKEQFDQLENKMYNGIWKDGVTTAEWYSKQGAIQGKKDYFQQQLILSPADADKWNKLLADLEEFDVTGKHYYTVQNKLQAVQKGLTNLQNGGIINNNAFSQERKDAALWAKTVEEADAVLRNVSGEVWRNAPTAQKKAIYEYTGSYSKFNEPLRGYEYGTNAFLGVGNVNLDEIGVDYGGYKRGEVKSLIDNMTAIIDKSTYTSDVWVQRGVDYGGMDEFFNISPSDFYLSESELAERLRDKTPTEYGFFSTGVSKGKGFSNKPIIMNVYAPAGTKMMYAEPFSQYGEGAKYNWDGFSTQSSFGSEAEMIFQRGTQFRVTKVEKSNGKIYVDLEVIKQEAK